MASPEAMQNYLREIDHILLAHGTFLSNRPRGEGTLKDGCDFPSELEEIMGPRVIPYWRSEPAATTRVIMYRSFYPDESSTAMLSLTRLITKVPDIPQPVQYTAGLLYVLHETAPITGKLTMTHTVLWRGDNFRPASGPDPSDEELAQVGELLTERIAYNTGCL